MSADLKESPVPLAEISQGPNAFEAFLDRNQKGVIVFAILLAIGAVIAVDLPRHRDKPPGNRRCRPHQGRGPRLVPGGRRMAMPDTVAAGSAMVLLADSQWTDGKKDEAVGTLQKFIAASPSHPAIPTAKASLGSKLMGQGKSGDATRNFRRTRVRSRRPLHRPLRPHFPRRHRQGRRRDRQGGNLVQQSEVRFPGEQLRRHGHQATRHPQGQAACGNRAAASPGKTRGPCRCLEIPAASRRDHHPFPRPP